MNLNPYWYVGPWEWRTENGESFWAPPSGCIGSIDLRSIPAQSVAGGAPQGMGLFMTNGVLLGSNYTLLGTGHHRDLKTDQRIRDAFPKRDRRRQPQGDDLLGIIYDALGDGSDPTGDDGPKPLMPSTRGNISICIGGITHSQWMKRGQRHWGKCLDVIRRDFARTFDDAQKGRLKDREHHRRVLDALCDKYRVDEWEEFIPQKLQKEIPGRLKHETTYTDNFNRADGALGANWTVVSGTAAVLSNQCRITASDTICRYASDLSSDDMYSQHVIAAYSDNRYVPGPLTRMSAAASTTYYLGRQRTDVDTVDLYKRITGTFTLIASTTAAPPSLPFTHQCSVDGSSLSVDVNAVEKLSSSDTAITGALRAGMRATIFIAGSVDTDDFECADLVATPTLSYTQLESTTRGYMRGTWTRG